MVSRREDCSGCCACAAACPHGAIRMEADGMGFRYPLIDRTLCVDCGLCEKVCAFKPVVTVKEPEAEAVRCPDFMRESQSGGVGYALMRKAVEDGMVVYGAAIDPDFVVRHRRVETLEGLEPLRLSKYVQSDMDGIPAQVLKDLKEGRCVLFSGTPCQCAGIGSLCAGYRSRLFLVDIICHGVPAPEVWKGFLTWNESKQSEKITRAVFRDPSLGWHKVGTLLVFESGTTIHTDSYYFLFMRELVSRPSCAVCPFACTRRPSDITIGDCWGVEKALPVFAEKCNGEGCSLVLVHTPHGHLLYESIMDACISEPVDIRQVLQHNLKSPSVPSRNAARFERDFIRKGFRFVQARYGKESPAYKAEYFLKKIKRHLPI